MKRALVFQHMDHDHPGCFLDFFAEDGIIPEPVRLFQGQAIREWLMERATPEQLAAMRDALSAIAAGYAAGDYHGVILSTTRFYEAMFAAGGKRVAWEVLGHVPIRWNRLIGKNMRQIINLSMIWSQKWFHFCGSCSKAPQQPHQLAVRHDHRLPRPRHHRARPDAEDFRRHRAPKA